MNSNFEVILFDLGGVLVELGENPFPPDWLPGAQSFRLSEWFSSQAAIAFEKGEIPPLQFANSLKEELNLNAGVNEIIEQFTQWPQGVFPKAYELLTMLQFSYRLAVFTNSNELHWPRILSEFNLAGYFDPMISSHLIHKAKPDPRAFLHVIAQLDLLPGDILFIDDNPANVASAKEVGMLSVQVNGPEELELFLINEKMIEG